MLLGSTFELQFMKSVEGWFIERLKTQDSSADMFGEHELYIGLYLHKVVGSWQNDPPKTADD